MTRDDVLATFHISGVGGIAVTVVGAITENPVAMFFGSVLMLIAISCMAIWAWW